MEEIKGRLGGFGVRMTSTSIVYGTKRKSGLETRKIKVNLSADLENLLKLYGIVGFNYCAERSFLARIAYSYLLCKRKMIEKRVKAYENAISMHRNGASNSVIALKLAREAREHDVNNWVKKHKMGKKQGIRVSEKDFPKFADWIGEHAIAGNGLAWETVESIKEVECGDVRDITTFERHHNFFANGFLTGNCGLVKNLSLMAEVTTETEEDPIEKLLNKKGVKLRKL
ncbi:MAG: hypothetical protein NTW59_02170 [Candidatus Diapherotrites archaeon]|nr:hypothetical protein [Candidatus Diapherotrites archaeon]